MAKIKFGMMMTDASGKLGGHVFAKNRGGSYVRTKATPSNPQTTAQMGVRGIFASISSKWSTISENARASFRNFVSDYARTDVFGDLRNPSGKALYQRLNQNLAISGQPLLTTCVAPQTVPFASIQSAVASIVNDTFLVSYGQDVTGCKVVFWATPVLSAGKKFVKNDLRQVAVFDGGNNAEEDIFTDWQNKFGALTANGNVYVGIRVINANGQASPLELLKATVA